MLANSCFFLLGGNLSSTPAFWCFWTSIGPREDLDRTQCQGPTTTNVAVPCPEAPEDPKLRDVLCGLAKVAESHGSVSLVTGF